MCEYMGLVHIFAIRFQKYLLTSSLVTRMTVTMTVNIMMLYTVIKLSMCHKILSITIFINCISLILLKQKWNK